MDVEMSEMSEREGESGAMSYEVGSRRDGRDGRGREGRSNEKHRNQIINSTMLY